MTPLHIDTAYNEFEGNLPSEYVPDRSFSMYPRGSRTTRYTETRQPHFYEEEGIPVNSVTPTYSRQVSFTPSAVYASHQDSFPSNTYNHVSPRYSRGIPTPQNYSHPVTVTPTATAFATTTPYPHSYRDLDYNPAFLAQSPNATRSAARRPSYSEFIHWNGEQVIPPSPRGGTRFPITTSEEESVESDEPASDEVGVTHRREERMFSSSQYGVMGKEGGRKEGEGEKGEWRYERNESASAVQLSSQIPAMEMHYSSQSGQHPHSTYSRPHVQSQSQSQSQLQGGRGWEDRETPILFEKASIPAYPQPSPLTDRPTLISVIPEPTSRIGVQSQVEETALPTLSRLEIPMDTVYRPPLVYQEDLLADDDEEDEGDGENDCEGYSRTKGMLPVIIEDPIPKDSSRPYSQTISVSPHAHSLTTTPRAMQRYACESDSYGYSPQAVRERGRGSFTVDYHGRTPSQHRLHYLNVSPRVARVSPSPRHSRPTPLPTIFPATSTTTGSSSSPSSAITPATPVSSKGVKISQLPLWTTMPYRAIWEEEDELAARARQHTPRAGALDRVVSVLGNCSGSSSSGGGEGPSSSSHGHSSQPSVIPLSSRSDSSCNGGAEFSDGDSGKANRSPDNIKDRIEEAIDAKRSCHFRLARTLFLSLVVDAPLEVQVWCEFIRMEMESGDYLNARTVLKSALQVLPDDETLLQKSLRIEERLGDVHSLLRVIGELCRVGSPKSAKTMMDGVMTLSRLGYEKTALEYYLMVTHTPRYSTGNFFIAYVFFLAHTTDQQTLWNTLPEMLSRFPKYGPLWFFVLDLLQHDCFVQWDGQSVLFEYGEFERVGKAALNTLTSDIVWKVYFMRIQLWSRLLLQLYHMDYPKVGTE